MKTTYKALAFATCLIAAGCLISATFVEELDFAATFNNGFEKVTINLADYDIDIAELSGFNRVDLEGIIRNDKSSGADTINVYISTNGNLSSKAAVEAAADAYPLLLGYVTKAGQGTLDTLTIEEARPLIRIPGSDWDQIKVALETGNFCIYFTSTGSGASGAVTEGYLWVTFTADA